MRVWKLAFHELDNGNIVEWYGSQSAAAKRRAERTREAKRDDDGSFYARAPEAVDIPHTKAALLDWLNANLNRDNG